MIPQEPPATVPAERRRPLRPDRLLAFPTVTPPHRARPRRSSTPSVAELAIALPAGRPRRDRARARPPRRRPAPDGGDLRHPVPGRGPGRTDHRRDDLGRSARGRGGQRLQARPRASRASFWSGACWPPGRASSPPGLPRLRVIDALPIAVLALFIVGPQVVLGYVTNEARHRDRRDLRRRPPVARRVRADRLGAAGSERLRILVAVALGGGRRVAVPIGDRRPRSGCTILLIGVDSGVGRNTALTDTMIVASLDPMTKTVSMISIPRDMVDVPLPDGRQFKPQDQQPGRVRPPQPEAVPRLERHRPRRPDGRPRAPS